MESVSLQSYRGLTLVFTPPPSATYFEVVFKIVCFFASVRMCVRFNRVAFLAAGRTAAQTLLFGCLKRCFLARHSPCVRCEKQKGSKKTCPTTGWQPRKQPTFSAPRPLALIAWSSVGAKRSPTDAMGDAAAVCHLQPQTRTCRLRQLSTRKSLQRPAAAANLKNSTFLE